MNPQELLKKTASLEAFLSAPCDRASAEQLLPRYTIMKQLSKCESEARTRKSDHIKSKIEKLSNDVAELKGVLDSSSNIAKSLKYLVDTSRLLVHMVNHSTRNGSIPMPREDHEPFLKIIKNSTQIILDKETWKASTTNWQEVSSVLKSTADTYRAIAQTLDYNLGEHHFLKQHLMTLLEQMSQLEPQAAIDSIA